VLPIRSIVPDNAADRLQFRDVGFVEFVQDAKTIAEIGKDKIFNWIGNQKSNGGRSINEVWEAWSKSMAAWTVFTLLLGFGDRHLDNLMVTQDGRVFHIDFGFVLGDDPKIGMPSIRLDSSLIDAMGGCEGKYYESYFNFCHDAFLTLRRHSFDIYTLLMHLPMADPPIPGWKMKMEDLNRQLNQRFLHGHTEEDAWRYFKSMLVTEQDSMAHAVNDRLHDWAKQKLLQQVPSKTYEYVIEPAIGGVSQVFGFLARKWRNE